MATDFKFPDVGEGITEGTIVKWLVKEGDTVSSDQNLAEIETDKAIVEIPSPRSGTILKISHKVGDVIKVGEVLAVIGDAGESPAKESTQQTDKQENTQEHYTGSVVGFLEEAPENPEEKSTKKSTHKETKTRIKATLKVRKLAKKMGVDLTTVTPTGPNGRVTIEDVEKASSKPEAKVTNNVRNVIAKHMMQAHQNTVMVTHFHRANVSVLWDERSKEKIKAQKKGVKLTFLAYVVKAIALTLKDHEVIRSVHEPNKVIVKNDINIGIAVDTPQGLLVPVIKNADSLSLYDIAKQIVDLASKAQERKLKPAQMQGGVFTITNLGSVGVEYFTPILNYPESAILGLGSIEETPVVENNQVVIRRIWPLSFTYDHQVIDGANAARFMNDVIQKIEEVKELV